MGLKKSKKRTFIGIKPESKEGPMRFIPSVKRNGAWVNGDAYDEFEGKLIDIKKSSYEYQATKKRKDTIHTVKMIMKDSQDEYQIEFNCSYFSRGLLNRLAGIKSYAGKDIYIRLYQKDGWDNTYVEVDGESVSWMTDISELDSPDTSTKEGKEALAEQCYEFVDVIKSKLSKEQPSQEEEVEDVEEEEQEEEQEKEQEEEQKPKAKSKPKKETAESIMDDDDDDLPF